MNNKEISHKIDTLGKKIFDIIDELPEDEQVIYNIDIPMNALVHLLALRILQHGKDIGHDVELLGNVIENLFDKVRDIRSEIRSEEILESFGLDAQELTVH